MKLVRPPHMFALPQELLDKIVDNIFDDHDTLLACSLVSKAFLPSTRYHLFAQTVVRLDRLGELEELRTASCSTIFGSIRSLTITVNERVSNDEANGRVHTECVDQFDFSGIRDLKVFYTNYQITPFGLHSKTLDQNTFRSVSTRVTCLTISDVIFDNPFAMYTLISSFTLLSTLELGGFKFRKWSMSDYPPLIPKITLPPSLKQLLVEDCDSDDVHQPHLWKWILAHNPVPSVHTASFQFVTQSRPRVSQYLNAVGPSIKHLTLTVGCECGPPGLFDLRANTNLETLQFGTVDADWDYDDIYHLWLLNTLSTVSSPHIHTLTITHHVAYMGESSRSELRHPNSLFPWKLDCARLEQVLMGSTFFNSLRRVEIHLGPASYPFGVKEDMPVCNARGILSTSGAKIHVLGDECRRPSSAWPYGLVFPS